MDRIQIQPKESERGSVLVLFAATFVLLGLALAMVLDISYLVMDEGKLQNIADSAALAAAQELIDEDLLVNPNQYEQADDILSARDYAEFYAHQNIPDFQLDRNEDNNFNGGIVAGYIDDPNNLTCEMQTTGIETYNSVKVRASRTSQLNGALKLLANTFTGVNEVEVHAESVATVEDRISGFRLQDGETAPILPFAMYEESWNEAFDGISDFDDYSYDPDTGTVTSGSDGVPEFCFAPWFPRDGIPGQEGNGRAMFIAATISTSYIKDQILNGMTKADLESPNIGAFLLTDDGLGNYGKWVPGEKYMSSAWHSALNSIIGEIRIIALFDSLSEGSGNPVAWTEYNDRLFDMFHGPGLPDLPETCTSIQEWYNLTGFQAVTVCESCWPSREDVRRVYMQPVQTIVRSAVIDSNMPHSKTVYGLAITR